MTTKTVRGKLNRKRTKPQRAPRRANARALLRQTYRPGKIIAKPKSAGKRPSTPEPVPPLPPPDADGNYPAVPTLRAILAQQIASARTAAGLTQAELAKRAGVRQETISRLEAGKHAANVDTVDRIDRALREAGV